ncbi:MAG: hypothetical protein JWP63_572, partial [Candidatus Solibacter sp.]|nr:hypothetical protein [Candidatus Solibacter sp.]
MDVILILFCILSGIGLTGMLMGGVEPHPWLIGVGCWGTTIASALYYVE